jgi:hypothetical protein
VRIEAPHLLFERVKTSGNYLARGRNIWILTAITSR